MRKRSTNLSLRGVPATRRHSCNCARAEDTDPTGTGPYSAKGPCKNAPELKHGGEQQYDKGSKKTSPPLHGAMGRSPTKLRHGTEKPRLNGTRGRAELRGLKRLKNADADPPTGWTEVNGATRKLRWAARRSEPRRGYHGVTSFNYKNAFESGTGARSTLAVNRSRGRKRKSLALRVPAES